MKHISFQNTCIYLVSAIAISSCTQVRYAYSPTIQNVPGLKEKNESRVNAAFSTPASRGETGFTLQGAYAVTGHAALICGYNGTLHGLYKRTNTTDSSTAREVKYNRNSFDVGAGIFYPISKNKKIFIEAYAGYGFGNNKITDNVNSTNSLFHNSKINRFFIQPVLSIHPIKYFTISLAVRYTSIGYKKIVTTYSTAQLLDYNLSVLPSQNFSFIETALVINAALPKTPWLMFQYQLNYSEYISKPYIDHRDNYISGGVLFDPLLALKRKKN